mmetsp:Transcript_2766/g.4234  ORF Transcript_2766/g.4234 Transcript_2766/m.4234 type:complete len:216 (+) Transcript_2766:657-1304(+)
MIRRDTVPLQYGLWTNLVDDESRGPHEVFEFGDGYRSVDNQLRFCGHHGRENQPWAVAECDVGVWELQSLKVLGLAGRSAHRHLLHSEERVDHGALPHVGVAHEADHTSSLTAGPSIRRHPSLDLLQQPSAVSYVCHVAPGERAVRWKLGPLLEPLITLCRRRKLAFCLRAVLTAFLFLFLVALRLPFGVWRSHEALLLLELTQRREENYFHPSL